jgi:hypothetical protein
MLPIDNGLKALYKQNSIPKYYIIYFPAIDLTINEAGKNNKLKAGTFKLTEMLCADSDLVFGSCESSQIKFTVADISQDLKDLEFTVTQTVGAYTIPFGTYKVDSCKKQEDLRYKDVVAYDCMRKFDADVSGWYNGLFPTGSETYTLAAFRASLMSHLGLAEDITALPLPNDTMIVAKTIEPTQLSGRNTIQACEEINGCFGHINRLGKFTHVVLEPAYGLYPSETLYPADDLYPVSESDTSFVDPNLISETISKAMYRSVKFEEYTVKEIDKLQIRQEEDDIGAIVGTGTNAYVIEGNFLVFGKGAAELETIALNTYGNIAKRPYRPYQSENIGLPYVEVGDTIAISTDDVVTGYVFQRTLTGIQALKDSFVAEGSEKREQNFGLNKEIIQLQRRTALIKKTVDEVSITLTDLAENTQSQFTQTTQQISAEVTRATQAEGALSGSITVMADNVALKVDKNGVIGAINLTSEEAKIAASKITFEGLVTANNNFKILLDGSIEAVNGKFSGEITASSMNSVTIKNSAIEINDNNIMFYSTGSITRDIGAAYNNVLSFGVSSIMLGEYSGAYSTRLTLIMKEVNIGDVSSDTWASINMHGSTNINGALRIYSHIGYTDNIIFSGADIYPSANNIFNLGRTGNRWTTGYFTTLYSTTLRHDGSSIGFFGNTPTTQKAISKLSTGATLSDVINKVNAILDVFGNSGGYGMIDI